MPGSAPAHAGLICAGDDHQRWRLHHLPGPPAPPGPPPSCQVRQRKAEMPWCQSSLSLKTADNEQTPAKNCRAVCSRAQLYLGQQHGLPGVPAEKTAVPAAVILAHSTWLGLWGLWYRCLRKMQGKTKKSGEKSSWNQSFSPYNTVTPASFVSLLY